MNNIIILNLLPSTLDRDALRSTFEQYNKAKNHVSAVAYKDRCFNKHKLSEQLYYLLRNNYNLPSQLTTSCIGTVVHDYKNNVTRQLVYPDYGDMSYDKRSISFKGLSFVSLSTVVGRLTVPFTVGGYAHKHSASKQIGYSYLVYDELNQSFEIQSVIVK